MIQFDLQLIKLNHFQESSRLVGRGRIVIDGVHSATEGPIEIAYRPVVNDFRGFRKVEIHIVDWRPATTLAAV